MKTKLLLALGTILPALYIAKTVANFNRLGIVMAILIPLMALVILNIEWGLYALLSLGFAVMFIKRLMPNLDSNQIGLAMEGILLLMGLRLLYDLASQRKWNLLKSPITIPLLLFGSYLIMEVFNPLAPTLMFGIHGTRQTLRLVGFFLVLVYLRSQASIKRFLWVWLALIFSDGLYGIWQHHHGLLYQEYNWLIDSKSSYTHILNGYIRIFGTLGDAATFGFVEVVGSLMLMALALASKGHQRVLLFLATVPMLYATVLSYSRGPIVGFAAGAAGLILASRNWKLGISVVLVCTMGVGGLWMAGNTHLVDRLASATTPTEDPSFQVRMDYLNRFLPEIFTHPIGFGLNTTGSSGAGAAGGEVFYGTTVGIPTDNQYFKYGLELGWFGLSLFIWFYLTVCWYCYQVYRHMEDPFLKSVALGLFATLCCFLVGAFSNDIYGQKPIGEFLYLAFGLIALLGQHRRCVWKAKNAKTKRDPKSPCLPQTNRQLPSTESDY